MIIDSTLNISRWMWPMPFRIGWPQHLALGQRGQDRLRDDAEEEVGGAFVRACGLLLAGLTQLVGQVQPGPGLDEVADHQADGQRDRRHHQEVDERQTADLPDAGGLPDRADAEHQGAEDDRADHHLDQVHESGAERFQLDCEVREQEADADPQEYGDDDGYVEEVGPVVADRRRSGCGRARHGCS
jgi:hypothetical protein